MVVTCLLIATVITLAGRLAALEDRNQYVWGFGAGGAIAALTWGLDVFVLFSCVIALFGTFVALWIAKAIDDRRAGRRF